MGRGRLAAFIVGAATIAAATFACRQLVGIGNDPPQGPVSPSTDAGAEGGFTYGQGACETCVTTSCGPQATACAGNPSCSALEACMSACGTDPTCRAQCGVDHGLGNDGATPAFEACLAGSCETQCGLTCGGLAALFPPATAPQCEGCIVTNACSAVGACAIDPACQALLRCEFSSETPDVQQACQSLAADAGGGQSGLGQGAAVASECSSQCSSGADWSCVGNVHWPAGTLDSVDLTGTVFDSYQQMPIDQAVVKVCNSTDQTCTKPLGQGTTGDAGIFDVVRQPVPIALPNYLDVSSPAIVSLVLLDVAPISASRLTIPVVPAVTMTELAGAAMNVQVMLDPNLGIVTVVAVDCRLAVAQGVSFVMETPDGSLTPYYYRHYLPTPGQTATDSSGLATFVNVPVAPSTYTITATPQALGRPSSTYTFFVRAQGWANFETLPNH